MTITLLAVVPETTTDEMRGGVTSVEEALEEEVAAELELDWELETELATELELETEGALIAELEEVAAGLSPLEQPVRYVANSATPIILNHNAFMKLVPVPTCASKLMLMHNKN